MKPPIELDQIADLVLNYRPKPKSKASRKRAGGKHGSIPRMKGKPLDCQGVALEQGRGKVTCP